MHAILAARSDFSIGESILAVDKLVEVSAAAGANAVAMTDTMSVTALIDFTTRAKKAGLKPIIGCRLRLVDNPTWKKTKGVKEKVPAEYYVTWYVLSEKGLLALFKLLSFANSDDRFYNNAKLGFDDLYAALDTVSADDVAIASSDTHSVVGHKDAAQILREISARLSASNTFLSLSPINTPLWDTLNYKAIQLAEELSLPTLVTRPVFYGKGGQDAAEVLGAITSNTPIASLWHRSPAHRDLHPLTFNELKQEVIAAAKRLRARYPSVDVRHFSLGLIEAMNLVAKVNFEWKKAPVSLPVMAADEFGEVVAQCRLGWKERFSGAVFGHRPDAKELETTYRERLKYELSVLKALQFSGYFLLVQDVVRFAKSSGILVGPGRGSVGGSLVAYLMGITDCDPLRFGLLFERFINPDRIDLPDADLDFMSERRHEIVDYLVGKFGKDRVAGVSNFISLGPASTIRDVGKAFGLSEGDYRCSKSVPAKHGQPVPLTEAADQVAEIGQWRDKYKPIWDACIEIEGTMKTVGQHAAGMVVGGCDLIERAVVERRKGQDVVCFDKRTVEDQGLVKMDILGLSTLDLIALTLRYIRGRHSQKIDLLRIPLDDPKVLEAFARAQTIGIFQFESDGMRRLLKELGKDGAITFDDITAATALYRPGPMESGMMDSYWKRKQGLEDVEYDHPRTEASLKTTYGVLVYQEQLMQISKDLCGFTGAEADVLRKAMGKKDPELMKAQKEKFVEGAVAGYAKITMDDGTETVVHRKAKFPVKETSGKFTIDEIVANSYSPIF